MCIIDACYSDKLLLYLSPRLELKLSDNETRYDVSTDPVFLRKVPESLQDRIVYLAHSLAHGCMQEYWPARIRVVSQKGLGWFCLGDTEKKLQQYLSFVWDFKQPDASLLLSFGYFQSESEHRGHSESYGPYTTWDFIISPKAFALLEVPLDHKVFISYKRSKSSAFALLLRDRLHAKGFDVFIDMQKLNPGEIWRERLEVEVKKSDVFICLISPNTLDSENVRDEIHWAMQHTEKPSIAIWHNGYFYDGKTHSEFAHLLDQKNAIIVEPEHVLGYENAITQLMQFLKPEG